MTCEICGAALRVSMWPFCPHGKPSIAVKDDALEGGPRFFDMDHQPVWCETKTDLARELDARNLRIFDDRAFENDKHVTNGRGYIDPQTLENARVLLSRGSRQSEDAVRCETFQSSVRELKSLSEAS